MKDIETRHKVPATVGGLLKHVSVRRGRSLWHVWQALEQADTDGEILRILRHWADYLTRLTQEARGLERRYLAHRNWFYHTVATQFCHRYQQIVVKLPSPRPPPDDREAGERPQKANTYRHLAALSVLLSCLRQAAEKTITEVKETLV